ncbi:MAG: FmdB family zinc ribbon protein [Thermodesulfovibrionales bacterium]
MPIYEYECPSCGKHYELMQRFSDDPMSICPECGGHVHKLISHSSFILKGTGWYVTDYASIERKRAKDGEEKTVSKTDSKADTTAKK